MLFREDNVARADADAIRKGVGFYRWTHDIVEITGKDALEVLISATFPKLLSDVQNTLHRWMKTVKSLTM
jgi:hypothetical protein